MRSAAARAVPACCLTFVSLAGCGGVLERDPPSKQRYWIQAQLPDVKSVDNERHLQVRLFHVAAPYSGAGLVYAWGRNELSVDFYHELLVSPGANISEICREWLARSGLFETVQEGGGILSPTHVLQGDVVELYGDYSGSTPVAVMSIRAFLIDAMTDQLLLHRLYAYRENLIEAKPAALVAGWGKELTTFLSEFEADLREALEADRE